MADNYLLFSEIVPKLGPDEEAWLRAQLQQIAVHGGEETAIDDLDDQAIEGADWYGPRFLQDYGDFDFESDSFLPLSKFKQERPFRLSALRWPSPMRPARRLSSSTGPQLGHWFFLFSCRTPH